MGPIAEENFVVAFRLSKGSFGIFFENGIDIVLWIVIILSLVLPKLFSVLREKKRAKQSAL